MELPATSRRVTGSTDESVNEKLWRETERRIWYYAWHPEKVGERLEELDYEWDIERALETNASAIALLGLGLTVVGGRRFLLLPTAVMGFLMQHALQGWCPPLSLLRRFGVRTQTEIEAERYALKALRGDFKGMGEALAEGARSEDQPADKVLRAVRH